MEIYDNYTTAGDNSFIQLSNNDIYAGINHIISYIHSDTEHQNITYISHDPEHEHVQHINYDPEHEHVQHISHDPEYNNIYGISYTDTGQLEYENLYMADVIHHKNSGFLSRITRVDMIVIYITIIIIGILFLTSSYFGVHSIWYENLIKAGANTYLIAALWVIASILSYLGIFLFWNNIGPDETAEDVRLSVYFLIGDFLSLLWAAVFFQGNNIVLSVWISAILFLYQFWLFIYIWNLKIKASLFMIPLIILYAYFFYSMVHLAVLNNIRL